MFNKLRGKLKEFEIDQAFLADKLGVRRECVSARMTGRYPWRLDEMYVVMELIKEPAEKLHEYFPKNGGATKALKAVS